jgi:MFS family permease
LLVQAAASTVSRWWAGRYGDRHGHTRLLVPALLTATAGMMTLIWVATPAAMLAGLCLFGIGFGISENATFAVMIDRVPRSDYGTASALWSLAYDGGYGAGPAMFGMFVIYTGYPAAFAITGMLMIAALIPAMRDRAAGRNRPADRSQQRSRPSGFMILGPARRDRAQGSRRVAGRPPAG